MAELTAADRPDRLGSLGRAAGSMAVGTALSRATGVIRVLVLAWALGLTQLSDAFNLANTVPNMLFDLVIGGVLSATFIPIFVDQLERRSPREAWRSISAVCTMALVVLVAACAFCFVFAPWVIDAFTALGHHNAVNAAAFAQQRAVATTLLRCFVPQIFFYGLISLSTALLNTQRIFAPPMWVPIANNLVCIAVLVGFASVEPNPSLSAAQANSSHLLLLGLGTTAGVAVQALLLVPFLWRAKLKHLWVRFEPRDAAVKMVLRLGGWTFGLVLANQVALFVMAALAFGLGGTGQFSAYSYAWIFLQTPYAIVAISVMSAVTPDLSARWSRGDLDGYRARFSSGLRAVLRIILPAAVLMFVLARPAMVLLLGRGAADPAELRGAGAALAAFALGLPGFSVFQFVVRALQTMLRQRVAFFLYLLENLANVALGVLLYKPLGVGGLALSVSIAYSLAAVAGLVLLRQWLGRFAAPGQWRPLASVGLASITMGLFALVAVNVSTTETAVGLALRCGFALVMGAVGYVLAMAVLRRVLPKKPSGQPSRGGRGKLQATQDLGRAHGTNEDRHR